MTHALDALGGLGALGAPAAEDIRDIRAPIAIPEWWRLPLAITLCCLAALAVVLAVRWWQRRNARPLTPHERALAALRSAEKLAREGRYREWAGVVAETLRGALSARLGGEVLPKTTSELAATTELHGDVPGILEVLEACDLARFAMARLDSAALLECTALARGAVDHLFAPAPAAVPAVPAPAAPPGAAPLPSQPVTST